MEQHSGAIEYDLRNRLHIGGLSEFLSDRYTWRERSQILWSLTQYMDSLTTASMQGWDRTWSLEAQVQSDLWNLNLRAHSERKPSARDLYPSPVGRKRQGRKTTSITDAQARIARLKRLQPGLETPGG